MVSGLASKGSNLAPLKNVSERLYDGAVRYVDGAHTLESGEVAVSAPSHQAHEITEIVESNPTTDFIIISHSMGALAALSCAENFKNVAAVSISPPLLYPISTLYNSRLLGRLKIRDDGIVLPSYSFALGDEGPSTSLPTPVEAKFSPIIFDEVAKLSDAYATRTNRAVRNNILRIVMPSQDWNASALQAAEQLDQVDYIQAPHSLQTSQDVLERNANIIASIAEQLSLRS